MSRAGRRARRQRFATGGAGPAAIRTAFEDHAAALVAERAAWVAAAGTAGWQAEQTRRRGERTRVLRARRLAGFPATQRPAA
jgi:hypothetical protein